MRAWVWTAAFFLIPASARAEDVLEKAAKFDPTVHFGGVGSLTIEPLLQIRWTDTERSHPPPDDVAVAGFSVPRARIIMTAGLYDAARFRLRIGTRSSGDARFEQAYGDLKWKDLQVRAGQFFLFLNAADEPAPQDLSTIDYATYANTFSGGQTQGMQLSYDGPVRILGTFGNGARSGFSELLSASVADIALTGRIEVPIGAKRVKGFGVEPVFRKSQGISARIGAHGHFQTRDGTSTTPGGDVGLTGGDIAIQGNGVSIMASATYLRLVPETGPVAEDFGFWIFGSVFLARRVEVWTQFDAVIPIGDHAPHPPNFASGQPGTTPFRTLGIGSNFYILPDVNRLKIQLDMQTMFDPQSTSIVAPNPAFGVLATPGAQIAGRIQLVFAL